MSFVFGVGEYETRSGCKAVVNEVFEGICFGRVQYEHSADWVSNRWHSGSGETLAYSDNHSLLPPKKTRTVAINFYPHDFQAHSTLGSAIAGRGSDCLATKEFTLEFVPGEGLQ